MSTHGHTTGRRGETTWSPTYITWAGMIGRVKNKPTYLAKGIRVCDRWKKFENFLADMGERPLGPTKFSLDRIDNLGDYEPSNCRWATHQQQTNNQQRNRVLVINDERLTVMQASRRYGVKAGTIWFRLESGWDELTAATLPPTPPIERHRGDYKRRG